MSLEKYRKKRDFQRTSEPSGKKKSSSSPPASFVIHKHAASSLHYDLRLAVDGVYKSWAVPKGPSYNPKDKRLAIHVEDHPLDYGDFEGVIPEDEYGGGTVMIWDYGKYENQRGKSMLTGLKEGQLEFKLEGRKLSGGWILTKMKNRQNQWLLIKARDDQADARRNPTSTETKSAKTNRTMHQIKQEEDES